MEGCFIVLWFDVSLFEQTKDELWTKWKNFTLKQIECEIMNCPDLIWTGLHCNHNSENNKCLTEFKFRYIVTFKQLWLVHNSTWEKERDICKWYIILHLISFKLMIRRNMNTWFIQRIASSILLLYWILPNYDLTFHNKNLIDYGPKITMMCIPFWFQSNMLGFKKTKKINANWEST
jgi:hypothetical protein